MAESVQRKVGGDTAKQDGVAVRIKLARERKGLSLSDLHKSTGLSRTALHDYESGRTKPGARELRILCETLETSPNWLLFGTEEPFKRRDGLKAFVKMKDSPAMLIVSMLVLPVIMNVFAEEEMESLLTIMGTLLEARDKEAYNKVSIWAEIFAETMGTGSPEELSAMSKKASDPEFMSAIQLEFERRLKDMQGT